VCYLAAKLGGALIITVPQTAWPLWPGCAVLVAILLLVPRKIWPALLPAGLAGFIVYDLQAGVSFPSIAWLVLADTLEILIAAWGFSYALDGPPRLNSLKAFVKYSFITVFLASLVASSIGIYGVSGDSWLSWRYSFLSEALAFLTVTPAILGLFGQGLQSVRTSRARYSEAAVLIAALVSLSYVMFIAPGRSHSPGLLYSLVPFLIWSALRFGSAGVGTSATIVALMSIWGAVHGRGPFAETDPTNRVLFLQLFLCFASVPFMVLAVLVEEHKNAEVALRESEERFRLVADTAPALIWMSGPDKLRNYFNQPWLEFTGRPLEAELGNGWSEGVHPEDLKNCLDIYTRAFDLRKPFKMQYRLRRHDGEYRWVLDTGVPRWDLDGSFAGYIGSCVDLTEGKLAEEALAGVGRRLLEAHEEERTWIARELHDDINQRIALLAVQLEQWAQHPPSSRVEVTDHIANVRQQLSDLGKDVQALSHRLHSSKLEYLGIVSAASSFCRELSDQQKVEIEFSDGGIPRGLPKEISLCLFRVLQEALQNAVKHSGERHFRVELRGTSGEIQLTVSDPGVGFDQQVAASRRGIGLVSMRERLQLVGGEFSIESNHGRGTTIRARVPLVAEQQRAAAAG
jgi:PAS domain S-box-containing protein